MLRRYDDGVDPDRFSVSVLDRDLGLAVGPEIIHQPLLANVSQPPRQLVSVCDRHRHQLGRLVAGESEHHPLVAGPAYVDSHSYVGRLSIYGGHYGAGVAIEAIFGASVADLSDRLPSDAGIIDSRRGRYLASNNHEARCKKRLACDAAVGIFLQDSV